MSAVETTRTTSETPSSTVKVESSTFKTSWSRAVIEAVPRLAPRRDRVLPILIVTSVLVHGTALGIVYWMQGRPADETPREIPVELVQLPPEPKKEAPKPPAKPEQPPPQKQAEKEPPKPAPKPPPPPAKTAQQSKPAPETPQDRLKDLLGPTPPGLAAAALPGTSDDGTETVSYQQIVMSQIAKAKKQGRYPGVPGYATVEFMLGDGGELKTIELRRPSGDASLDEEALALIRRGEPYPPPPPGGRRDYVVTLQFRQLP